MKTKEKKVKKVVALKDEYSFRKGSVHPKMDPKDVVNELQKIAEVTELTPEIVLKTAKNVDNPLHDYFEWDNTKAAFAHRLQQARTLIACVEVTIAEVKTRVFHNIKVINKIYEKPSLIYMPVEDAVKPEYDVENLSRARSYLETFVDKFKIFPCLKDKVDEIEEMLRNW